MAAPRAIDVLLTRTQQRVLALLFADEAERTLSELVRRSGGGSGAIRREVERMTAAGLLRERRAGRERRFSADPASPFYPELKSLAGKAAARTLARRTRPSEALHAKRAEVNKLLAHEGLRNPRVFGSVARGTDTETSDLDILVDAPRGVSLLDIVGAQNAIEDLLRVKVHLLTPSELPESIRKSALAEAIALSAAPKVAPRRKRPA